MDLVVLLWLFLLLCNTGSCKACLQHLPNFLKTQCLLWQTFTMGVLLICGLDQYQVLHMTRLRCFKLPSYRTYTKVQHYGIYRAL